MKHGRFICDTLKQIRLDIARANGIEFAPVPCTHEGECAGTCPACEREMRFLEREIARKRSSGRAALIAGVSLAMSSLTAMAGNGIAREAMMADYSSRSQVCDSTAREEVFGIVEQMPQFRGGEKALMDYLNEHIIYPPEAVKDRIEGRVVVQFLVEKDGSIGEVKVVRSVDKYLDAEVVRVVKTLPKFSPGRQLGKVVSMWYTLPVTFKLAEDSPSDSDDVVASQLSFPACDSPDVMPEFPGGLDALMNFLSENIRYPKMALKNKVQGRVVVQFVVDKTGKVGDFKVLESVDDDLAEEAVRVCRKLPNFTPGLVDDEPVNVIFALPVNFKLPADNQ